MHYQVVWEENTQSHRVLQEQQGPCPLIGIFNVLLLRGSVRLDTQIMWISFQEMIDHIKRYFEQQLSKRSFRDVDSKKTANDIKNFEDARKHFPNLEKGLDINVKFSEPDAFEFTTEVAMFDLYGIRLVHAWTVDPQMTGLAFIREQSYNELTSFILSELDEKNNLSDIDIAIIEQRKDLARNFLQETSSQITAHGLFRLHEVINESEICVLFRNNHFATITKHKGKIYLLVTDRGLVNDTRSCYWQSLSTLDGDSVFLDSSFRRLRSNTAPPISAPQVYVHDKSSQPAAVIGTSENFYSQQQRAIEFYKSQQAKKSSPPKAKLCVIM